MSATPPRSMTVAQLERLPQPVGGHFELFRGSLITVACPRWDHYLCQEKLRAALAAAAGELGLVGTEMPFRPLPEHNFLRADVAFLTRERAAGIAADQHLAGAPELIVEIIMPPSAALRVRPRKQLCLENGCQEYWIVEPHAGIIEIFAMDGTSRKYRKDERIPIPLFNGAEIDVGSLFS